MTPAGRALAALALVTALSCADDDESTSGRRGTAGDGAAGILASGAGDGEASMAGTGGENTDAGAGGSSGAAGSHEVFGPPPLDACDDPIVIGDGSTVRNTTAGWPRLLATACSRPGEATGPEAAYVFTASEAGVLDVHLTAPANFSIAARTECRSEASEQQCVVGSRLLQPVASGETVYIVLQGADAFTAGTYELTVDARPIACGDGNREGLEECDDRNGASSDGCSSVCVIEASETEPNETAEQASALATPFFASISVAADVDMIRVDAPQGPASIVATIEDFGDGACSALTLDSKLEILDAAGAVLSENDDDAARQSFCSHAVASALAAGTYYVRVSSPLGSRTPNFGYVLNVSSDVCGNGVRTEGEQCDNGSDPDVGGCSTSCIVEQ
jgi:cysteine-rich repeat protein